MSGLQPVADLGRLEAVLMASACFALVAVLALTGRMRLAGLLDDKSTGDFDPVRLQLLASTLLCAGLMLTSLDHMRATGIIRLGSNEFLYAIGGSQGLYLIRKFFQTRRLPEGA